MGIFGNSTKYNGNFVERARIVGVRTAEQTKVLGTYNYGVYSILVMYTDGAVELVEEKFDSPGMKTLIRFMEV